MAQARSGHIDVFFGWPRVFERRTRPVKGLDRQIIPIYMPINLPLYYLDLEYIQSMITLNITINESL